MFTKATFCLPSPGFCFFPPVICPPWWQCCWMINILCCSVGVGRVQNPWTWNPEQSGVANVFPISSHHLNATHWKTASIFQRPLRFATMLPTSVQDSFHIWLWPLISSEWWITLTSAPNRRLGLQRHSYGSNLSVSEWQEGNRWWQNCPSEQLLLLCACVCVCV